MNEWQLLKILGETSSQGLIGMVIDANSFFFFLLFCLAILYNKSKLPQNKGKYKQNEIERKTENVRWPGIEPGSTAWKAAMLTTIPPTPRYSQL